jgi:hypothetical protein
MDTGERKMTDASLNSYLQATQTGLIKSNKDRIHKRISGQRVSDRSVSSGLSALHKEGRVRIVAEVVQPNGYKGSLYEAV